MNKFIKNKLIDFYHIFKGNTLPDLKKIKSAIKIKSKKKKKKNFDCNLCRRIKITNCF